MLITMLILCGCATTSMIYEGGIVEDVEIYYGIPERAYEELGMISATSFPDRSPTGAIKRLARKAKRLGADAIIDLTVVPEDVTRAASASGIAVKWISKEGK